MAARPSGATADQLPQRRRRRRPEAFFEQTLARYRRLTSRALLDFIPREGPPYLYELVSTYPRRGGKGLRAALCLATCGALGGSEQQSLNSAVAIELFHNAFLLHDDVQDGSLARRGGTTLYREHGVGIAVNVGNATNLLALQRVVHNRTILGPETSWHLVRETERMMRHSLEGQAIELGWIRDNVCRLEPRDYLHMCLKKTSWYSFIYPLRAGALVAEGALPDPERFCRFGWYIGAAFQVRDDILNLTGSYTRYGKEIGGDLWEGKRTLMLIHLLGTCAVAERRQLRRFLAKPRVRRTRAEVRWVYGLMGQYGSIEFARRAARQLAGAALIEALTAFRGVPDSEYKRFILEMVLYVVRRDR
jgi:geranylgeranyl diphosphate synthase type II